MSTCRSGGFLVDGQMLLPVDPTMVDAPGTSPLGCNHLRCARCGADVRNAAGLAFKSRDSVDIAAVYSTTALANAAELHQTQPAFRLYLCRCTRWLMTSTLALALRDGSPDADIDPPREWQCAGHPALAIPGTVDGASIVSRTELRVLAASALQDCLAALQVRTPLTRRG